MAAKDSTVWELAPHTAAKHAILRRYLGAFYPKIASWARRIVFIDGFAGPGGYAGGEPGSPVIAIDTAKNHPSNMSHCEFVFLFFEQDEQRFDALQATVNNLDVPGNFVVEARQGSFADNMQQVMDGLGTSELAPTFVMVDPFGVKGAPFRLVEELAKHRGSEVLVSLMAESIKRFVAAPEFEPHLDAFFGGESWRTARDIPAPQRPEFFALLYTSTLKDAGYQYVRRFEMRDARNQVEYFLMYGTHSIDGLKAMKDAMWSVDKIGGSTFSDATNPNQLTLFKPEPDFVQLREEILAEFSGKASVPIGHIEVFVVTETAFRETHFKKQVLSVLEKSGSIHVLRPRGKTGGYWNTGTFVTFG